MQLQSLIPDPTGRRVRLGRRFTVNEWECGLLFRWGQVEAELSPGRHVRWRRGYRVRTLDLRPWVLIVPTQEVPIADGATVKITLSCQVRITDATRYVTGIRDNDAAVYLALQLGLRQVMTDVTLDALVADRTGLAARISEAVGATDELAVTIDQIAIKDVILPPELKRAQGDVLLARAQGLAALERARGETAALRSLANAARMAADNPTLLQLRLLQQLESSSGHTVVLGGMSATGTPA